MQLRYARFLMLILISANAFAGVDSVVVSNEFPSDGLMLENHVYKNAAVFENIGVYDGTIYAKAIYENIPRYCDPGYYIPENATKCVICVENHYCIGGENATMQPCSEGLVSPVGTVSADNCGKIMRVGEDMLYLTQTQQTTPALAVRIDGKIYYAKIEPLTEDKNQMNNTTNTSLRTKIDGVEYYIHDNTIQGEQ